LNTNISEVGLGCWQIGGSDWGAVSEKEAFAIFDQAIAHGVTFWDTADVYGGGRSEQLIGAYLKQSKPEVFVATKLGRSGVLFPHAYSEKGVRDAVEQSLERLGVDALDLIQLHCVPMPILREGAIFDWLRTLRAEGKIRAFGASVESMAEAELCLQQEQIASLQIIFNLFRQKPLEVVLPRAAKLGVGIIVRLPLASGLLSGRFNRASQFAPSDHRTYNRNGERFNVGETFAGLPFEVGVELADELRSFVPSGMDMAVWAQRWLLDHAAVSTVITGASKPAQVTANGSASSAKPLSDEAHAALAQFYRQKVALQIRGPY
jgi:aryl-alcohol dehydrogenase-like predicted oxidoreductase